MTGRVPDFDARHRAVHEDVRFIDAAAGSGKTETIVLRVVRHVVIDAQPLDIERIGLATFTIAAAAELRARVRQTLEDLVTWAGADPDTEWTKDRGAQHRVTDLIAGRDLVRSTVAQRAETALRNLDAAPWGTLHSMCLALIGETIYHQPLPAAAGIRGSDEDRAAGLVTRQVIRRQFFAAGTFDEIAASIHVDVDARLLLDMGMTINAIETLATQVEESIVGQRAHDGTVHTALQTRLALIREASADAYRDAREAIRTTANDILTTTREGETPSDTLRRLYLEQRPPLVKNDALAFFGAVLASELDEGQRAIGSFLASFVGVRGNAFTASPHPKEQSFVGEGLEFAIKGIGKQQKALGAPAQLWAARLTPPRVDVLAATQMMDAAVDRAITSHGNRTQSGRLIFDDLIALAAASVPADNAWAKVGAGPLDLLVVDEVQDSDPAQHELLAAFDRAGVPTVVVGDSRQSIYGFRGATPALFDARLGAQPDVERARLSVTFRHSPPLTRALNALFATDIPRGGVRPPAAIAYRNDAGLLADTAPLRVRIVPGEHYAADRRDQQARVIASQIQNMHHEGLAYRDIAVLSPTRAGWGSLRAALRQCAIPFTVEAADLAWQSPGVRGLSAVLRWLAFRRPLDRAAALLSPWLGLTLGDLAPGSDADQRLAPCEAVLASIAADHASSDVADTAVRRALSRLGGMPLIREVAATRPDIADQLLADMRFVLDEAAAYAAATGDGLRGFVATVIDGEGTSVENRVRGSGSGELADAVHVTTIHAAKGLQYGHVLVLGADTTPVGDRVAVLWPEGNNSELRGRLAKALVVPGTDGDPDRVTAALAERAAQANDRLLYVALTRAKDSATVVLTPESAGDGEAEAAALAWWGSAVFADGEMKSRTTVADELLLRLRTLGTDNAEGPWQLAGGTITVEPVDDDTDEPALAEAGAGLPWAQAPTDPGIVIVPTRTGSSFHGPGPSQDPPPAPSDVEESAPGRVRTEIKAGRQFGSAVHDCVEMLALLGVDPDNAHDQARRIIGRLVAGTAISAQEATRAAVSVYCSPILRSGRIEHEYPVLAPITAPDGQPIIGGGVIDIIAFHDDHTEIYDIKTDQLDGDGPAQRAWLIQRYEPQLRVYARAMEAAGAPPVTVLGLLLTSAEASDGTCAVQLIPALSNGGTSDA